MNGVSSIPHIERLEFFNGQRLFAEDLQTLDGFNRQMRWLHNRSLHTFGIGSGFVVRGERGDREVTISPGYAIDNEGREIILLLPRVEPVPPVADDGSGDPQFYDLAVHYPRIEDLEELETRFGICSTHGVVRRREEPVFCWIELKPTDHTPSNEKHVAQIASGEKIVIARISVKNCRLETLSIANRRNVRTECLPYIACGRTTKGETSWREITRDPDLSFILVETLVNTSQARFATAPCYTARIAGKRFFPDESSPTMVLEAFTMIENNATPAQFVFRALVIPLVSPGSAVEILNGINQEWSVEWMGVEG